MAGAAVMLRGGCLMLLVGLAGGCVAHGAPETASPAATHAAPGDRCPPAGRDRAALESLAADQFVVDDPLERNALALALLDCLGDPDPYLRDDIAYSALATMMRREEITPQTARIMLNRLTDSLAREDDASDGFARPFAALALAEIARMDRVAPFLAADERGHLVHTAHVYLASVTDYRGFAPGEGWRHGVAHGADLAMQLALNERVDAAGLRGLLIGVFEQVAPASPHFYIYGEPQRLARPVLFAASRGLVADETWRALFDSIVDPAPFEDWTSMYRSRTGLARIHNTRAFAHALVVGIQRNPQADFGGLTAQADRLMQALP